VDKKYLRWVSLQYGTKEPEKSPGSGEAPADMEDADTDGAESSAGEKQPVCLSGFVRGEHHLDGKPAVLTVVRGDGRVVIFNFNPLHRHLTLSNFGLVYNAILNWND